MSDVHTRLERANQRVIDINKAMGKVEIIENVINATESYPNVVLANDTGDILKIDEYTTKELRDSIKKMIHDALIEQSEKANTELDILLGNATTPIKNASEGDTDTISDTDDNIITTDVTEPKKAKDKQSKMDVDTVIKMLKEGKTTEDIREYYGYKAVYVVRNFIRDNHIHQMMFDPKSDKLDDGKIRACYTNGPKDLQFLADEFKLTKKQMHEYCKLHNLLKPTKKDLEFLDGAKK